MPQIVTTAIAPTRNRSPLADSDKQIIANVLTWDTQSEVMPEEVITIAINHDIVWVRLTGDRSVPLHVETFRSIRRQQLEQQGRQVEVVPEPEIEIDSNGNNVYRAWKGLKIIGVFYKSAVDGRWLAHPACGSDFNRYGTPKDAQQAIVGAWQRAAAIRDGQRPALQMLGGSDE